MRRSLTMLLAVGAFSGVIASLLHKPTELPQARMTSSDHMMQSTDSRYRVSAYGTLEPITDVYTLAGPTNELGATPRIRTILVSEGQSVYKGQVLVIFDNTDQFIAEKARITADIDSKRAEIAILQKNIIRFDELAKEGSFPASDYEEKTVRLQSFKSQLQALIGTLNTINTRIDNETVIRSPISGTVLRVNAKSGERSGLKGVVEVGDVNKMQAVIQVEESDVRFIRRGQKALIKSENGSFQETLMGTVGSIGLSVTTRKRLSVNPGLDSDPQERVVDIKIHLDAASSKKVSHLTGVRVTALIGDVQ